MRVKTISWNANPPQDKVETYEVWCNGLKIVTTKEIKVRAEIPYDQCAIVVRAVNGFNQPSPFSEAIVIPSVFDELKTKLQFSDNLVKWSYEFKPNHRFARIEYTIP